MLKELPGGVFPACLTPLNKDLSVNFPKLNSHCQQMLNDGCDGLVLMGTTGEANSFSVKERKTILESVLETGIEPHRILLGTGCCSLPETEDLTTHALKNDVFNVLVLPPFYYGNIHDDGLLSYFDLLVNRISDPDLRIFLYHFPKMSGVPFGHDVIEKLRQEHGPTIAGIKDSSGDWDNMLTMCSRFPEFKVYTGNEIYLHDLVLNGGEGTISATVNFTGRIAAEVFERAGSSESHQLQEKLTSIRKSIEKFPMIPMLKLLMSHVENDDDWLNIRPPLSPLRFWNEDEVKDIIHNLQQF